jgi:putative endonuclease
MAEPDRTPAQRLGDRAETFVAGHLANAGWTILERNVRVGRDELDIVALDPGPPRCLVVVEVRWRASRAFGLAEETVDGRKQARLRRATWRWLEEADAPRLPLRFDLIVVEPSPAAAEAVRIRHHRAAF